MNMQTLQKHNQQKGMALILAIGFLAVLSILGAVVMNVATEGMKNSGLIQPKSLSFYTADRSVEYSMNRDLIINLPILGTVNLVTDKVKRADGTVEAVLLHKTIIEKDSIGTLDSGTVIDLGPRELPPVMAEIHGTDYGANMYHVNVETSTPLGGETHVDAAIVRLFKSDDETIFRTTGTPP
jgi:hypothetical protein